MPTELRALKAAMFKKLIQEIAQKMIIGAKICPKESPHPTHSFPPGAAQMISCIHFMRVFAFGRQVCALAAFSALSLSFIASKVAYAQSSVQRDQQALTILEKSIATAGGTQQLASIQDLTETGTVTYYWVGEPTGTVTVKCKGLNEFRIDADLPDGKRSIVVSGTGGYVAEVSGSTSPIHPQSAADIGSMTFPVATLVAAIEESSTSLIFGGLVTHNGASVYDVRLQKVFTSQQDPSGLRAKREARDFYFDPETYLVVAIADQIYVGDRDIAHEVIYSDYKPENGVSVPLTITETSNGVKGFTMQINQVTINSQMSDSDFAW